MMYNSPQLKRIEPEIEKILWKNKNGFQKNRSSSQILTIRRNLEVYAKKLEATLLFVNFSEAFDSIRRRKMEKILLVYGLPKGTVTAIMMLYKNTKVKVRSPDGDRLLWHCCWSSARGYVSPMSVHNLRRLHTLNVDRYNERKWFHTQKKRKKQTIPAQTITDADYAVDTAFLANALTQAGYLLDYLVQAASGIGLHINVDKIEYNCFN